MCLLVLQPDVIKSFTSDPRIVALAEFFLGQADLVSDAGFVRIHRVKVHGKCAVFTASDFFCVCVIQFCFPAQSL